MIKIRDFLFIFLSLFYLELFFNLNTINNVLSYSLLIKMLFTLFYSTIIYLVVTLFKPYINKLILFIILIMFSFLFATQLVYYKTYEAIMSFYSFKQAGEVMEFAGTIFKMILTNLIPIILMFLPAIIFIIINKKFIFKKTTKIAKLGVAIFSIILYSLSIISLNINKSELYSAHSLYHNDHTPVIMVEKLGLLTEMRLDIYRTVIDFKGKTKTYKEPKKDEPKKETVYSPNALNIDFDGLIANESDSEIKTMHQYFKDVTPTDQNKYTGMFKGKNLILILAEALDPIAVDKDITPTLYKLVNEGFNFTNFYTPVFPVSTSDGEYIQQTSLIPKEGVWSLKDSSQNTLPFTLAHMFLNEGYNTTAYHGHSGTYYGRNISVPNLGYQNFYACKLGLNINCRSWPESDVEVVDVSVPQYINYNHFMTYYISISGHLNYTRLGNSMVRKNWEYVENLSYSEKVKGYLSAQKELDSSLKLLIEKLDAAGKLDDTVIAISPDHYPYGLTLAEINEKSSYVRDDVFEKHRSVFIVWNSKMKAEKVETLSSNMDVLPTLANLFNLPYDSRLVMGRDIFSEHESLVILSNRSWITDKGKYNQITKAYSGEKVDDEYISKINGIIYNRFKMSKLILDKNYYKYLRY